MQVTIKSIIRMLISSSRTKVSGSFNKCKYWNVLRKSLKLACVIIQYMDVLQCYDFTVEIKWKDKPNLDSRQ